MLVHVFVPVCYEAAYVFEMIAFTIMRDDEGVMR